MRTLLIQLAGALSAAHAQQIVHRDIKPANILVDRSSGHVRYVLTDFGIGRRQEGLQAERHTGGTYQFMAPEQLRGRPGPQSDLWALGVVAYRLLAGRLPFPGPTLADLSRQIQFESPPPPGTARGEPLPYDLETAVMRLLDKSLTERTPSAEQLLRELGYQGDSTQVTQARSRAAGNAAEPVLKRLSRSILRSRLLLYLCIVVYILPTGLVSGTLLLAGITLFFHSQSSRRGFWRAFGWTCGALFVLAAARGWESTGGWDVSLLGSKALNKTQGMPLFGHVIKRGPTDGPLAVIFPILAVGSAIVYYLFLPVIGSAAYAKLRRGEREKALWDSALAGQAGTGAFLERMQAMVDCRVEDVGFHLRYAELLYARGDYRGAAVETRLLLVQDPYHFNGNLLLANSYAALGLWSECRVVCDEYLQVSGYCFEFSELRQQCDARTGRT